MTTATHASSGQHWYALDGTPVYQVPNAKGDKMVNATLAHARKMNLVPGVTGVMGIADKPGLTQWKMKQVLMASLTTPRNPDEPDDNYCSRIMRDAFKEATDARDIGTEVHAEVQEFYTSGRPGILWPDRVQAIVNCLDPLGPREMWTPEKSVASPLGYGTKADLSCPEWVIDFKGKDVLDEKATELWIEHYMQLAATRYALGYHKARCAIVFFSREGDAHAVMVRANENGLEHGMDLFESLLMAWQVQKKHYPTNHRPAIRWREALRA